MNNWNFVGRLGEDAETRFTKDGTPVVGFSVAVDSGYGDRKVTTWARCNLWGRKDGTAPGVTPYLVKGQQVAISGEITLEEWQTRDGATKTSLKVRVNNLTLTGEAKAKETPRETEQQSGGRPVNEVDQGSFDDDIPF
jgi:single-strand DNA-binding protein